MAFGDPSDRRLPRARSTLRREAAGHVHGARLQGRAHVPRTRSLRPVERLDLPPLRGRREARDGRGRLRPRPGRLQLRRPPVHLRGPAPAGPPAAEPGARPRHELLGRLQHRRELRDQHQLAGLRAARPSVSYLTQMLGAGARELRLGRHRHGASPSPSSAASRATLATRARQLLGRLHAQLPLHPAADLASCGALVLVSQGVVQNLGRAHPGHARSRASRRRSRRGRSPRRRSSRSSAPTAAATSTPTRRTRSRTRRRSRTSSRCSRSSRSPLAFTYMFGRFAGQPAPGLGALRRRDGAARR